MDKSPFADLFANSQIVELSGGAVRVLRHEDNLRVVCVHWFTDGGIPREKLWDIYYLVVNRPADFDWDECLNANGAIRRQWIISALAVAHRYLDLPVDDLPFAHEIKNEKSLPRWLVNALEREWVDDAPVTDIIAGLRDWQVLRQQLKKRFPPNPIAASVLTEAPFDDAPRFKYQLKNMRARLVDSLKRNLKNYLDRAD